MRALFYDSRGYISLGRLKEAPLQLRGLTRRYARTGHDAKRRLVVYEREPEQPLQNWPAVYQKLRAERNPGKFLVAL